MNGFSVLFDSVIRSLFLYRKIFARFRNGFPLFCFPFFKFFFSFLYCFFWHFLTASRANIICTSKPCFRNLCVLFVEQKTLFFNLFQQFSVSTVLAFQNPNISLLCGQCRLLIIDDLINLFTPFLVRRIVFLLDLCLFKLEFHDLRFNLPIISNLVCQFLVFVLNGFQLVIALSFRLFQRSNIYNHLLLGDFIDTDGKFCLFLLPFLDTLGILGTNIFQRISLFQVWNDFLISAFFCNLDV